jgi:general L-amino acid transport system permease protein
VNFTGYAFAALFYFVCCWGMSRYSISVERRLATGYKR